MSISKGEIMKKLGMIRNVDSALPHPFIQAISEKTGIEYGDIIFHFVMDYRDDKIGEFTPITNIGVMILQIVNHVMEIDLPFPEKVYSFYSNKIETV